MQTLDTIRRAIEDRHEYARKWKERTGGKVLGYLCTYVPEELFYAAGVLPVRIIGSHEPEDLTAPHLYGLLCSYSRDCLAQGLAGRYEYLDGLATAHGCVHIRQTYDSWRRHIPVAWSYCVAVPQCVHRRGAKEALAQELADVQRSLEEWVGRPIAARDLEQAIEVYNANRRLLKEVYQLRKEDNPPISGAEALELVLSSMLMDKEEHTSLLRQVLDELQEREPSPDAQVRTILVGQTDDLELVRLIESLGASIVADELCFGSRYFWTEVRPDRDPLGAIAARYIEKPPCPMKDLGTPRVRVPYMLELAREYRARSAIVVREKFCDPHEYEGPAIQKIFQENGIPVLMLEQDVTVPLGQLKTRLEAHMEMLTADV